MAMTWREAIRHQEAMNNPGKDIPDTVAVNRAELRKLIEAAKRMRELQSGGIPYNHQATSEAEAAFDAAIQPFEGDK